MPLVRADLHVHTVLSPCAQVEMIPPYIVSTAQERGIGLIAITDHNATANIAAVQKAAAAAGSGLAVMPGVELQTREEIHLLCLFDSLDQSRAFQAMIDAALPPRINDPEHFGAQYIVDETGELIREETRLLLVSTELSMEKAISQVHSLGGLAIPAHIDRKAFGLIAGLGFVPPNLPVDALEITRRLSPEEARRRYPQVQGYPLIQGSDAHHPDEMHATISIQIDAPTVGELRRAFSSIYKEQCRDSS